MHKLFRISVVCPRGVPRPAQSRAPGDGISIDCAEILKIWKLVDDLLKRPNTKGVLGIHQLTNKIH